MNCEGLDMPWGGWYFCIASKCSTVCFTSFSSNHNVFMDARANAWGCFHMTSYGPGMHPMGVCYSGPEILEYVYYRLQSGYFRLVSKQSRRLSIRTIHT